MTAQAAVHNHGETRADLERFTSTCQSISLEAHTVADFESFSKQWLPKLQATLADAFRFLTTWDYSRPETLNVSAMSSRLKHVDFTDLDDVMVSKPVGFYGHLSDYAADLVKVQTPLLIALEKELTKVNRHLGRYLQDPSALKSLTYTRVLTHDPRDALEKEAEWYIVGNRSSEGSFTDLYANKSDYLTTLGQVNTINAQRWKNANPNAIARLVQSINQIGETVLKEAQTEGSAVSRRVVVGIADDLELAARWVEHYSVITTHIMDLTSALKTTEKKLLRAL